MYLGPMHNTPPAVYWVANSCQSAKAQYGWVNRVLCPRHSGNTGCTPGSWLSEVLKCHTGLAVCSLYTPVFMLMFLLPSSRAKDSTSDYTAEFNQEKPEKRYHRTDRTRVNERFYCRGRISCEKAHWLD